MYNILKKHYWISIFILLFIICVAVLTPRKIRRWIGYEITRHVYTVTPEEKAKQLATEIMPRLKTDLDAAGFKKLPDELRLLIIKDEKIFEIWGKSADNEIWKKIKTYNILAASGTAGPKLIEGDRQVPEGIYKIDSFHPQSHYYLALKLAFPNAEDIQIAEQDGRNPKKLGNNIMIHGYGGSRGCIALEDNQIEEVFYLSTHAGIAKTDILIMPFDFRKKPLPQKEDLKLKWLYSRYLETKKAADLLQKQYSLLNL